ncbi:SigE family RNA polymerase sigma factor [Kitasatospora sp. NPDC058032]|uniref:SigE family RNA polymerase sigma factor n=1 Tax=Kitasatospora sp. NPDC058032 TaxID=3346307 RepID=UPI0036D7F331
MTTSAIPVPVDGRSRPAAQADSDPGPGAEPVAAGGGPGVRELGFEGFAATRWRRLVRTAYLLTGDHHEAEDVVQATLAKVFRSWSRISGLEEPDAYVHRALVNNNLSRHRRRRVRQLLVPVLPERAHTKDVGHRDVEERSMLLQALAELPPRQRAVVVLRYWEDMSEHQVAEVLGCSAGNVKSQASRGLAKLRGHPALALYAVGTGSTIEGTDGDDR